MSHRKRNNSHISCGVQTYGPRKVDNDGDKIYNFCRKHFSAISKRDLRKCLLDKSIFVNDRPVRGAADATLRLQKGDMVKILWDNDLVKRRKLLNITVDIKFQDNSVMAVLKPPGTNAATGRLFDEAVMAASDSDFCQDKRFDCFLWRLQKSVGGVHLAVKSVEKMLLVRGMLCNEHTRITSLCLVAGYAGDQNSTFDLTVNVPTQPPTSSATVRLASLGTEDERVDEEDEAEVHEGDDDDAAGEYEKEGVEHETALTHTPVTLHIKVVRSVRCRSTDFISLIEVTPRFERTHMGLPPSGSEPSFDILRPRDATEYAWLHHPTFVLRSIPRVLRSAGLSVIGGEDGLVKRDKGLYMSLTSVYIPITGGEPEESSVIEATSPLPEKMEKLMAKEEELYEASIERDMQTIRAARVEMSVHNIGAGCSSLSDEDHEDRAALQRGKPLEYILGFSVFCGFRFEVNEDVMVPRRSSEALVHAAVHEVEEMLAIRSPDSPRVFVLDIGTGSGCLLLSVLALLKQKGIDCAGVGIDICPRALSVARRNAAALELTNSTIFLRNSFADLPDLMATLLSCSDSSAGSSACNVRGLANAGGFDVILCNPPYSSLKEVRLSRARVTHEPAIALFAEGADDLLVEESTPTDPCEVPLSRVRARKDPFRAFNTIVTSLGRAVRNEQSGATQLMRLDGSFVLEFGHGQASKVRSIFERCGCLQHERSVLDYNRLDRGMVFKRKVQK